MQARDVTGSIDELRPDLVLTSFFAFGAMVASQACGTPFDIMIPNTYQLPARGLPQVGTGFAPARGPLGALRDRITVFGGTKLIDKVALEPLNALRSAFGLAPLASTWDQVHQARCQLILSSASFDFPAILPANAYYVGPILDDPVWTSGVSWVPLDDGQPLVLVAMSSTFQNHVQCMQRIVDALGNLPVRGLVTTGPAIDPGQNHPPANVCVMAVAPQRQIMEHCSLVITHGGHDTVVKALAAGVPLVILEHGRDQSRNAIRVTLRGAGLAVSRKASVARITRTVTKVLQTESYGIAAAALGRKISADADNEAVLVEVLEG